MWKRTAPPVLISALIASVLYGCIQIKPTYTKERIAESIILLCQKEYNVEPKVWLLEETVWIYLPVGTLITNNLQWQKEALGSINKVLMGSSRVILSMRPRPQFMVIVASDIEDYGIDYQITSWIPDIVKYQLQLISRDEFSRRSLIKITENIDALRDKEGLHLAKEDITLRGFLAEQIIQRIRMKFTLEENFRGYFKLGEVDSVIQGDTFRVKAYIEQTGAPPKKIANAEEEIAKIIAYVIREYEIKDFLLADIKNTASGQQLLFTRSELGNFLR